MNYIWSKLSLLKFLEESIWKVVTEKDYQFSDLFAWTWIVGRYFKQKGHRIIANDLQYYSYVLNRHYIWNHQELESKLEKIYNARGPIICVLNMSEFIEIMPKTGSRTLSNGQMVSRPMEDMYPYLFEDELKKNMIIEPVLYK